MEFLAVESFLADLRDFETKQALLLTRSDRLVDSLTRAVEFEAVEKSCRNQARFRSVGIGTYFERNAATSDQRLVPNKRDIRYWNYVQLGHVRSHCKKERKP